MKKLLLLSGLLLSLSSPALKADTVTLLDTIFDGGLSGGEFTAVTGTNGTFNTFCLEYTSAVYTSFPYVYQISNAAVSGGNNHVNTPGYDVLSQGSAYLYTLFRFNQLPGYATTTTIHKANGGALQKAFWALEDEWTFSSAGGLSNPFLAMAVSKFGSFSAAQNDYTGTEVRVMNIDTAAGKSDGLPGTHRQDQLIYVPDGGLTIALLGAGLVVLGVLRRRLT